MKKSYSDVSKYKTKNNKHAIQRQPMNKTGSAKGSSSK